MPNSTSPQFIALWERPVVSAEGDRVTLLVRITTPPCASPAVHPPVDVAFALDRSGSMSGQPIELVKKAIDVATGSLRNQDRVAVVAYDDQIDVVHPLQPASPSTRCGLRRALDGIDARGSTNLCDGWLTACQQLANRHPELNGHAARARRSLLLTDGLANVGTTSLSDLVTHAHELRRRGITTSTLGVGEEFDEVLLSSMAEAGGGNFQFIPTPSELPAFFEREIGGMLSTVASHLQLIMTLPRGGRGDLVSTFPVEQIDKTLNVSIGDVSGSDEITLIFNIDTSGAKDVDTFSITIRGEWTDAESARRETSAIPVESLTMAPAGSPALSTIDQEVAEHTALQHAARKQREAMRLDREGRYSESRQMHKSAHDFLAAAPQTGIVASRLQEAFVFAEYNLAMAYPEEVRKRNVHNTMRRTRGHTDDR